MKRYIKNEVIKYANEIVINKDGINYYHPSEEMILADGWVEYIEPIHEPTLDEVKADKIQELNAYNMSDEVNTFSINGQKQEWFDTNARVIARDTCNALQRKGQEQAPFGETYVPIGFALSCLDDLNIYAMETMQTTKEHEQTINALQTIEEVEGYDYKVGFPATSNFIIK